jgi:hypothetical protein
MNKQSKHVFLIPEDDAIRQLADGFIKDLNVDIRRVQVDKPAAGWLKVQDVIRDRHFPEMRRFSDRYVVMLIDFDNETGRLDRLRASIPEEFRDRVFVLGIASESEDLKKAVSASFEDIGARLAVDCQDGANALWGHELLRQNAAELERLREYVAPFLFRR